MEELAYCSPVQPLCDACCSAAVPPNGQWWRRRLHYLPAGVIFFLLSNAIEPHQMNSRSEDFLNEKKGAGGDAESRDVMDTKVPP